MAGAGLSFLPRRGRTGREATRWEWLGDADWGLPGPSHPLRLRLRPLPREGEGECSGAQVARPRDSPQKSCQTVCKPGSVPSEDGDDHSSGPSIAGRFSRPTRTPRAVNPASQKRVLGPRDVPIRSCSRRGLPCRSCYQARGGLLPHPFTLPRVETQAVCFLWRSPSGHPGRALPAAFSPWSPDFPRRGPRIASWPRRDRPTVWRGRDARSRRRGQISDRGADRDFLNRGQPLWRGNGDDHEIPEGPCG